jgi:hypothetical protein
MARLLLVALLCYAGLDASDPMVAGAVDFDDDVVVMASSSIEPRARLSPTIATLPRWVAMVRVESLQAPDRLVTHVRPTERVPQLRPRRAAALRPASASEDD